jgi:hypothetical protein
MLSKYLEFNSWNEIFTNSKAPAKNDKKNPVPDEFEGTKIYF